MLDFGFITDPSGSFSGGSVNGGLDSGRKCFVHGFGGGVLGIHGAADLQRGVCEVPKRTVGKQRCRYSDFSA